MFAPECHLASWPEELLQATYVYLDQSSFFCLCCVSRGLHRRTLPWLYSTVCFGLRDAKALTPRPHDAALLLRSLLHNQYLAGLVEHVDFAVDEANLASVPQPEDLDLAWLSAWRPRDVGCSQGGFTSKTLQVWKTICATHSIQVSQQQHWLALLEAGRVEAIIACILFLSINLQSLRLGSRVWRSEVLDNLLTLILSLGLHKSLDHIDLCPDITSETDVYFSHGTYQCLPSVLHLPRISSFSAPLPAFNLRQPVMFPPRPSTLRTLNLKRTRLSEELLGVILRSTTKLESLSYWSCFDADDYRPGRLSFDECLDCEKLGLSLLHVRQTLVELYLAFHYFSYQGDFKGNESYGFVGTLRSLNQFTKLTKIMAPYPVLLGWSKEGSHPALLSNILPRCVRDFTLTDDLSDMEVPGWSNADLVEQMKYLEDRMSLAQESKSPLKLEMHIRHSTRRWNHNVTPSIKELCAQKCLYCRVLEPKQEPSDQDALPMIQRLGSSQRVRGYHGRCYRALRGYNPEASSRGRGRGNSRVVEKNRFAIRRSIG